MFSDVSSEATERIHQSTLLLNQIKSLEEIAGTSLSELLKIQKGMFFVSLYAAIEYATINSCSKFLSLIEGSGYYPMQFKNKLLCVLLDPEFSSVIDCGKKTVWGKKEGLIQRIFSDQPVRVDNTVFPSTGINIGVQQLKDVWNFMHIPGNAIPLTEPEWYLNEIKDNRNAIAHGRLAAAEVGKRYTYADLEKRHHFVSTICGHVVSSFDDHITNQTYLKDIS